MTSLLEQMNLHRASRMATAALETASRSAIERVFQSWENGELEKVDVRTELEKYIREAYRTSAAIARGVAQESSDIYDWEPTKVVNNDMLQNLLEDSRRNLRAYKRGELSRSTTVSRIQHSAGTAAQRGYTDQIIESYGELEDLGLDLRKYWVANFVDNQPCPNCVRLHGTWVGLRESFPSAAGEPGVYRDLQGPPRHPNCQCRLFIFVVSLENAFHTPNFDNPQEPPVMMSVAEVKALSQRLFNAIRAALRAILRFLRGRRRK